MREEYLDYSINKCPSGYYAVCCKAYNGNRFTEITTGNFPHKKTPIDRIRNIVNRLKWDVPEMEDNC